MALIPWRKLQAGLTGKTDTKGMAAATEHIAQRSVQDTQLAYIQTYSTADKTHALSTASAVSETASTQTSPYGYSTQAQANAICVELNDLMDDVVDLKQLIISVIDDLQVLGLVG